MTRQIKFRAWDKEGRIMVTPDAVYDDGSCRYVEARYQGEQEPAFSQETLTPEGCVLMQFTGILDKNGKEIYEGDIVQDGKGIAEVTWNNDVASKNGLVKGLFGEYVDLTGFLTTLGQFEFKHLGERSYSFHFQNLEIIGNIYENPELLQSAKEKIQ